MSSRDPDSATEFAPAGSELMPLVKQLSASLALSPDFDLLTAMRATVYRGLTDADIASQLMVARQYGLNPWTREIFAYSDKGGRIVPVVSVDGWARIINSHPMFDGMDFDQDGESCTCSMYRKDRKHPVRVTEWLDECRRDSGPWKSHPKRMLRHKSLIQCARMAFGFAGIYDQDEAERIVEASAAEHAGAQAQAPAAPTAQRAAPRSKSQARAATVHMPHGTTVIDADTGEMHIPNPTPAQAAAPVQAAQATAPLDPSPLTPNTRGWILKNLSPESLDRVVARFGKASLDELTMGHAKILGDEIRAARDAKQAQGVPA